MINKIVLNHHSLPFKSKADADDGILEFLNIIRACRKYGLKILLVDEDQDTSLMNLKLYGGYHVRNWYSSTRSDSKLIDIHRSLRSAEISPIFELNDFDSFDSSIEVGLSSEKEGNRVLTTAFYLNTFLVSFTAKDIWKNPIIQVWVYNLNEIPEENDGIIYNLYDKNSITFNITRLEKNARSLFHSGKDLWKDRNVLFPHIILLPDQIGTTLQNWPYRKDILKKARSALNILDKFCELWKEGKYSDYRHNFLIELGLETKVTGESASVKTTPRRKKERLYWLDDGRKVFCQNHIKLPAGYRMYFYPDSKKKCIYVAYLGPHLN